MTDSRKSALASLHKKQEQAAFKEWLETYTRGYNPAYFNANWLQLLEKEAEGLSYEADDLMGRPVTYRGLLYPRLASYY